MDVTSWSVLVIARLHLQVTTMTALSLPWKFAVPQGAGAWGDGVAVAVARV
jgi:hypothetical protein